MRPEELTKEIIGAAIEVHKALGRGLLESAYEECLCHDLGLRELAFERQPSLPLAYKSVKLDCGYRVDIVVEGRVVVEINCVNELLPVHEAQILTYVRLGGSEVAPHELPCRRPQTRPEKEGTMRVPLRASVSPW